MTRKNAAFALTLLGACTLLGCSNNSSNTEPTTPDTPPVEEKPELPIALEDNQAALFYKNEAGYDGWGVHIWNDDTCSALTDASTADVTWQNPKPITDVNETYGAYFVFDLASESGCINYILHKGDEKAFGDVNGRLDLSQGNILYTEQNNTEFTYAGEKAPLLVNIQGYAAHWVNADTLMMQTPNQTAKVEVRYSSLDTVSIDDNIVSGGTAISTQSKTASAELLAQFPHLSEFNAYTLPVDIATASAMLKGPIVAIAYDADDKPLAATRVQTPGAIDAYFADSAENQQLGSFLKDGATHFALWAPTALQVDLLVYDADKLLVSDYPAPMTNDNGIWRYTVNSDLSGAYYRYRVQTYHYASKQSETLDVTDPYALSLSTNSLYSQVVDLSAPALKPEGWDDHSVPTVDRPEQNIIYEMHIRDFSIADESMPEAYRGKYLAFTQAESDAVKHLASLQAAGMNHVHLLPTFDIATVNEDPAQTVNLTDTLGSLCAIRPETTWCTTTDASLSNPVMLEDNQAIIFYQREDQQYDGWGLHLWNDDSCQALADTTLEGVTWQTPKEAAGIDENLGAYYVLDVTDTMGCFNFIVHRGDDKALGGGDLRMTLDKGNALLGVDANATLTYLDGEPAPQFDQSMTLADLMAQFDPNSTDAQTLTESLRHVDSFNWGYDPFHYTAPEGSYATDAEGSTRIREFRAMVKALHDMGFRVVMDVVYNHTNASALWDKSVLDKIVPGYYHRRNPISGAVETSSCCDNTASEHRMMEKLMIDSLVTWADAYKIDGFRFDLMGHHMKENMLTALEAVKAVDPDNYFYGEAWNFGEVQDNARGVNAIQKNMGGTGIGSFNDRARDAVRGGGPFDSGQFLRSNQGYGTGLHYYPNELADTNASLAALQERTDWIKLSLTGNLKTYELKTFTGESRLGQNIDYVGQEAGYTLDPQENVNYISKHDNQTLWDNLQYKAPKTMSTADRVRLHHFSNSIPLLSQGIVFTHMGVDLLRSKSMQRDSYDAGDWYNQVDFTGATHNWHIGLPSQEKDGMNYSIIETVIQDMNAKPTSENIATAKALFKEWLQIRTSTPLFSLPTADMIQTQLSFIDSAVPGLIIMHIEDATDLDENHSDVLVIFNPTDQTQSVAFDSAGFELHPVQQNSVDAATQASKITNNGFDVPPLTTGVFIKADQ